MSIVEMNKAAWEHQLAAAKRGARIMYHVGYLPIDRATNRRLSMLASAIYSKSTAKGMTGLVYLLQNKLGPGQYEYYTVKR